MTFTNETAQALIAKYNLAPNTINIWKNRGAIPDKYADPDYVPRAKLSDYDKKQEELLIAVLKNSKLNASAVIRQVGIHQNVLNGAIRTDKKRVALLPDQTLAIKKNVQELRIKIKAVVEPLAGRSRFTEQQKKALDGLLLDPRLMVRGIFGGDTTAYTRHIQRNSPSQSTVSFDDSEASEMVDKLSIFLLETAL